MSSATPNPRARLSLLTHTQPEEVLAYRAGRAVPAHRFLGEARELAEQLPDGGPVLNLCTDRYQFAVGLAAALIGGRATLLPSTRTPTVLRQLLSFAPDLCCLTDESAEAGFEELNRPCVPYPNLSSSVSYWPAPMIDPERVLAWIFTSGSSGTPVPHRKRWGPVTHSVRIEAHRLQPLEKGGCAILGTVPPQHMYGLESTVLLAWQSRGALCAERPLFPADVLATLRELPRPRVLITTPVHLRALLQDSRSFPPLDLIVSATAPLSSELAVAAEARFATRLMEIYGATETGQFGSRRTALEQHWRSWPQVQLDPAKGGCLASGGHIESPALVPDLIELLPDSPDTEHGTSWFAVHGRSFDLVNIAGKRSSLEYLNHQLTAIPGVLDGAFLVRDPQPFGRSDLARLVALVVAPTLEPAEILAALRRSIDPAFLPRPLLKVERLPRNATGKLPLEALQALFAQMQALTSVSPVEPAADQ